VRAFLATGQDAPVLPTLAAPLSGFGPDVAVLVQLPILLALCLVTYLLARRFASPGVAAGAAAVVCLAPPVLAWSLMVHMALLATLAAMAFVLLLLQSGWFERTGVSALVGVCAGMLALSRSMAPVYVAGLAAGVVVVSLTSRGPRLTRRRARNMAIAAAAALLVAGPWWVVSGPAAWQWLSTVKEFGVGPVARKGIPGMDRLAWSLKEAGPATVLFLAVVVGTWAVGGVRRRPGRPGPGAAGWGELGGVVVISFAAVLVVLGAVASHGTAFDLPVLVPAMLVLILAAARAAGGRRVVAVGGGLLIAASVLAMALPAGVRPAQLATFVGVPTYENDATLAARGVPLPQDRSSALLAALVDAMQGNSVVVFRDDPLVNANGVNHELAVRHRSATVNVPTYAVNVRLTSLDSRPAAVITGTSCYPYHVNVDNDALESSLRGAGYGLVWERRVSDCNVVRLWDARPGG
jgi:hypothetical protein